MKKLLLLFVLTFIMFSCSKEDDCQEQKDAINAEYKVYLDNPNISSEQRSELKIERDRRIRDICN